MNPATEAFTAKKKFVLLSLLLLGMTGLNAQVRLGILGGLHSSNVLETNKIPGWDTAVKKFESSRSGAQVGVILEVPLGHKGFFFQPAITYTSKGRKFAKNNDSAAAVATDTVYSKQDLDLNYIDIPLNITYKFYLSASHKNSFFLSAGPQLSFFYSGKVTSQSLVKTGSAYASESDPVNVGSGANTYKTFDLGVNGRAGFEFGNVMLSAYFSRGLTSFYNAPYEGSFHHQLAGASLGIWLSSSGAPAQTIAKKIRIIDSDKDGIPDDVDRCPFVPGPESWQGCPVRDSDHDGIDDKHDSCKNIPGVARYNGCPIPDSDHDGVNDEEDKCPTVPGLARYNGCPIPDRDGDGVNDEEDQCPDTPGSPENHGCPIIKKETTDKINYIAKNILFTSASDELTDSSSTALHELSNLMRSHPELHLTIEGYTDNSGNAARNLELSQKRAMAVLKRLVSEGVPEKQLTARGFGQEHPMADNSTLAGRAANRRVELKLNMQGQ